MISKYMERKEFDKAEELLRLLPEKSTVDKKQIQANLFIEYGKLEEASKLEEEKLLSAVNDIQTTLITMMEIAIKEDRQEDAEYIADVCKNSAKLFDLWEYNSYIAHFGLYLARKNYFKCVKIFVPMMKSLLKKWDIKSSPLYRHVKTKDVDKDFGIKMQKNIMKTIYSDKEASILQENKEVQELAEKLNLDGGES